MALYNGFFDFSAQVLEETGVYDREYNAGDFVEYFASFLGSGVCVYQNPDSMKVTIESGRLLVAPGYLFLQGYWLANRAEEGEDPASYRGYWLDLPASGTYAVAARLDLSRSLIELTVLPQAESYPDCLVLALADADNGTVTDTRGDMDLCGLVDALGDLSSKVVYAVNYIDNEIEDRLKEAEAQIAAQDARLDQKIREVAAQVKKIIPPPIGTVQYTASQNIGEEWLRCDGSFITEADYPELVQVLGKLTPGIEEYNQLLGAETSAQMSNGVFYEEKLWVYLIEAHKLVGVSPEGKKEIPVTGADGIVPLTSDDVYLSIANGSLYLVQTINNVLEAQAFTGNEISLEMTALNVKEKFNGESFSPHIVPLVIKASGTCHMMVTSRMYLTSQSQGEFTNNEVKYLSWRPGDFSNATLDLFVAQCKIPNDSAQFHYTDISNSMRSITAFSHKSSDEALIGGCGMDYIIYSTANTLTYNFACGSILQKVYGDPIADDSHKITVNFSSLTEANQNKYWKKYVTDHYSPQLNIIPVAANGEILYTADLNARKITITYCRYTPQTMLNWYEIPIQLPARAKLFKESAVYAQGLWFVFVGTGILFCETLENANWGYLDTQEMIGVITRFGCLEYDQASNALYISGMTTNGTPQVVRFQFPDIFNYANDGAWLPLIASDGVPAYIKAKAGEAEEPVPEEPGENVLTVTVRVPGSSGTGDFPQYYAAVLINGETMTEGTYQYKFPTGEGKIIVGLRAIDAPPKSVILQGNGAPLTAIPANAETGTQRSVTLDAARYLETGLQLYLHFGS